MAVESRVVGTQLITSDTTVQRVMMQYRVQVAESYDEPFGATWLRVRVFELGSQEAADAVTYWLAHRKDVAANRNMALALLAARGA